MVARYLDFVRENWEFMVVKVLYHLPLNNISSFICSYSTQLYL